MKYKSEIVKFIKIEFLRDYDTKVHFLPVVRSGRNWYMLSTKTCCNKCDVRELTSAKIEALVPMPREDVASIALELDRANVCEDCLGIAVSGDEYTEDNVVRSLMSKSIVKDS